MQQPVVLLPLGYAEDSGPTALVAGFFAAAIVRPARFFAATEVFFLLATPRAAVAFFLCGLRVRPPRWNSASSSWILLRLDWEEVFAATSKF